MKLLNRLFLFCFAALIAAIITSSPTHNNVFAMEPSRVTTELLYSEIGKPGAQAKPNFIFSPFSILSVFHCAQKGASGETKKQMDALVGPNETFTLPELHQTPRNEGAVVVDVANRLYVQPTLEENKKFVEFRKQLEERGHQVQTLDFTDGSIAASKINAYIASATHDHIKNLISSSDLNSDTRLVLVNALYFKAPWLSQFKEADTVKGVFITPSGPKEVPFMTGKLDKGPILYSAKKEGLAVALPYQDPRLRLYIFMPEDLGPFEEKVLLVPDIIEGLIMEMEYSSEERGFEEELHVTLPKFKLSAEANKVDLVKIFQNLGAPDMFDMQKADFSGITGNRDLFVSSYVHQADIEVNEQGTEATAATAMAMMLRSMPMPKTPIRLVFDKPFMFQLRFHDGNKDFVLFSGRLADPSLAQ